VALLNAEIDAFGKTLAWNPEVPLAVNQPGEIASQHYAFLIGEDDFDRVFARVRERGLQYWADPAREQPGEINRHFGGRGMYFDDPDGHFLEVITRPYVIE